jgi:hypothetical protein
MEISSRGEPTGGGPPAWKLGVGLTTPGEKYILLQNVKKALGIGRILWIMLLKPVQ